MSLNFAQLYFRDNPKTRTQTSAAGEIKNTISGFSNLKKTGTKMPSLKMRSPKHELALLASIAISVCGSTLLQHLLYNLCCVQLLDCVQAL
jgi:hypothetical protein